MLQLVSPCILGNIEINNEAVFGVLRLIAVKLDIDNSEINKAIDNAEDWQFRRGPTRHVMSGCRWSLPAAWDVIEGSRAV